MELESCQNPAHTQNVFCSRTTIHTHAQCGLQIQNIIHKLMYFASIKYKLKSFKYKKNPSSTQNKYGTLKVARGSEDICAWISKAENECQKSRDKQMSCDSRYTTAGGAVESV